MSMLWLNGGVKGVKVLMQRGFPHMLSWEVLLVFFCVYFVLASYTSGTSVPAGLIVPMLLLGGSYGRAIGLLGIEAKRSMCEEIGVRPCPGLEVPAAPGWLRLTSHLRVLAAFADAIAGPILGILCLQPVSLTALQWPTSEAAG